ncbi:MAG TPA: 4,5-DOPA dioxygenase extradiol [Geobacteraceae bacterium]
MSPLDAPSPAPALPVLFVGHGTPMNAIEETPFAVAWREAARGLPRPRAILCISAHWETSGSRVTALPRPQTIHDFYGFPEELYRVRYPAPGSMALAERVRRLVRSTPVEDDLDRGLDHGTWTVLRRMYPEADVPVVQLSLDRTAPPRRHYEIARELLPLRREGVLIIGSGNLVHNLSRMRWDDDTPYAWAREFDRLAAELILAGDHDRLIDYPALGDVARLSVPTNEHYLPLLYALALQEPGETPAFFATGLVFGSISMRSLRIG